MFDLLQNVSTLQWSMFGVIVAAVAGPWAMGKAKSALSGFKLPTIPGVTTAPGKPSRAEAFEAVETLVAFFDAGSAGLTAAKTCGTCLFEKGSA